MDQCHEVKLFLLSARNTRSRKVCSLGLYSLEISKGVQHIFMYQTLCIQLRRLGRSVVAFCLDPIQKFFIIWGSMILERMNHSPCGYESLYISNCRYLKLGEIGLSSFCMAYNGKIPQHCLYFHQSVGCHWFRSCFYESRGGLQR